MSLRTGRVPFLLVLLVLFFTPKPAAAVPDAGDQALVFFIGGVPVSVKVERFLKPPPVVTRSPGGGGANELSAQDTKGQEKSRAPALGGPDTFTFVKRLDHATPKLYEAACKGTHLETTKWKNLVLKRGVVRKYAVERIGGVAMETIEIAYESVDLAP